MPGLAGEHQCGSVPKRPCRLKNLQGVTAERHPVLTVRLRPLRREGPHTLVPIDLGPLGPPHLTPPRRREHQKLESQLDARHPRRCPYCPEGCRYLAVRQRRMCSTTLCCGPRTEPTRSQGLSMRCSIILFQSNITQMPPTVSLHTPVALCHLGSPGRPTPPYPVSHSLRSTSAGLDSAALNT